MGRYQRKPMLATMLQRDRAFIRRYGPFARDADLRRLLKLSETGVSRARRAFKGRRRMDTRAMRYPALFEAYHGRPPRRSELPPPQYFRVRDSYAWSDEEEAVLLEWHGLVPREELARKVTVKMREVTRDPAACRTPEAVQAHAGQMGLDGRYLHGKQGIISTAAARASGIPFSLIYDAIEAQELTTFGEGKYRYITWSSWLPWRNNFLRRRERRIKAVAALPEKTISTREARQRLGIGESHLGRYLAGKILRAWKIGVWYISARSVEEVRQLRARGQLSLDTPEFKKLRRKANRQSRQLRRRQRREPGHTAPSRPGYVRPLDVAYRAKVSYATVYDDIKRGWLAVEKSRDAAGRERYEITVAEADRYVNWIKTRPRRLKYRVIAQMRQAGCMPVTEAMQRLDCGATQLQRFVDKDVLHPRMFGQQRGFAITEVELLAERRRFSPPDIGRAVTVKKLRPAGHLSITEVAQKCGHEDRVRRGIREGAIRAKRITFGRSHLYYIPANRLNQVRRYVAQSPRERAVQRRQAELQDENLWPTRRVASHLKRSTPWVIKQVALGNITPRRRERSGFAFAPRDIKQLARHMDGRQLGSRQTHAS